MVGAVLLVSLLVIGSVGASIATAGAAAGCGWCWYVEPLRRRRALDRAATSSPPQAGSERRLAPAGRHRSWDTGAGEAG
jgi:hypothetical protein